MSLADLSSECLARTVALLTARYTRLWPLQTFNACNPLLAYENIPFSCALQQAQLDLNFSNDRATEVLRALYCQNAFTLKDVEFVLAAETNFELEKQISLFSRSLTYREVLFRELQGFLLRAQPDTHNRPNGKGQSVSQFKTQTLLFDSSAAGKMLSERIDDRINQQMVSRQFNINPATSTWINEQMTKWLAAYLDDGQALWLMPNQQLALRYAWSNLVRYDTHLPRLAKNAMEKLIDTFIKPGVSALDAMASLFASKALNTDDLQCLVEAHLKAMPGWVGYLHYVQENQAHRQEIVHDYLLIRSCYYFACEHLSASSGSDFFGQEAVPTDVIEQELSAETLVWQQRFTLIAEKSLLGGVSKNACLDDFLNAFSAWADYFELFPLSRQLYVLMQALEHAQNRPLIASLASAFHQNVTQQHQVKSEPDAQAVFCIDVRSEPFRKILEEVGNVETYGFAGFFGLPVSRLAYGDQEPVALCPVLLQPQYTIKETPSPFLENSKPGKFLRRAIPLRKEWVYALKKIRRDTFATFSYVESFGMVHLFTLLKDSFASVFFGQLYQKVSQFLFMLSGLTPRLDLESGSQSAGATGIALSAQIELARTVLTHIGFRQPYAEFIIICGHVAKTRNNPYASALDCGACGGNGGAFNALVLCQILNHPDVREALAVSVDGFSIPEHTRFIAAQHDTTTDEVTFLNLDVIHSQQQQHFLPVQQAFEKTTILNRVNRQKALKTHSTVSHQNDLPKARYDWSQTRPEWGLSKNQAFIIGEREAIKMLDLEGRCFLHSYNWQTDPSAESLTMIMTAPMIVGSWINLQYCFSTLDSSRFGSGKKYLHNIVGLFGAYAGNASDLQVGLPYESVFANDGSPYHYPQRLLVYIQAPLARVKGIIDKQQAVQQLVTNQWINLMVFDPEEKVVYQYCATGWQIRQEAGKSVG